MATGKNEGAQLGGDAAGFGGVATGGGPASCGAPASEAYPARPEAPRLLALDVGSVRIGVALSCPFGQFARPLTVVLRRGKVDPLRALVRLACDHEVAAVVVGRPLRLNGEVGPAVLSTEKFVATLAPQLPCPVVWWDERLTTRAAERTMVALGARRDERRGHIDKVAAALILQGYLDAQAHMP